MNTEEIQNRINRLTFRKTRIENRITELGDTRPKRVARLNEKLTIIQEKINNLT